MPFFAPLDLEELQRLKNEKGLSKRNLQSRNTVIEHFGDYIKRNYELLNYETAILDKVLLQESLCKFLLQLRINDSNGNMRLAKRKKLVVQEPFEI